MSRLLDMLMQFVMTVATWGVSFLVAQLFSRFSLYAGESAFTTFEVLVVALLLAGVMHLNMIAFGMRSK